MRRHLLKLSAFLILAAAVLGCRSCDTIESTKVAQSEIYQDYSIETSPSATTVTATFRVGGSTGTTVDLDAPSKIEYNGNELHENLRTMTAGTNYNYGADEFIGTHQFVYTNGEGRLFRNSVSFTPIGPIVVPPTIKIGEKTTLLLSRPLGENESIETSIISETRPPQNSNNSNRTNADAPANRESKPDDLQYSLVTSQISDKRIAVEIGRDAMRNFVPGKARLKVVVYGRADIKEVTPRGGLISYTYRSGEYLTTIAK